MNNIICLFTALAVAVSAMAETSPVQFRGIPSLVSAQRFSLATDGGDDKEFWQSFHENVIGTSISI